MIFSLVLAYLFGSIPFALVIGKVFYHTDIRQYGSGNLGGSNAGRVLGKKAGITVTILDALKGLLAMVITSLFAKEAIIYAGLAACIGHCFPLFAGFKGGKAIATTFGYLLGISLLITHQPLLNFIVPILVFFGCLYLCRIVSISSLTAIFSSVVIFALQTGFSSLTICTFILWIFIVYRHRQNIIRLMHHEESTVKWMPKRPWDK